MAANSLYFNNKDNSLADDTMIPKIRLLTFIMVSIGMLVGSAADARQTSDEAYRQALMDREMDCIDRQLSAGGDVSWKSTCSSRDLVTVAVARAGGAGSYADTPTVYDDGYPGGYERIDFSGNRTQPEREVIASRDGAYDDVEYTGTFSDSPSDDIVDPALTTVDIGTEVSHYRYAEPEFMRLKGYLWGIFGAITYRTSENKHIKTFRDIFSDENSINMFRLDAKFSGGDLDYESEGTGKNDGERNYMFEVRGSAGYDIPVGASSRITPFAGFGYRYLKDDSGGTITTTGAYGYDRESFYYYLPLGIETQTKFNNRWLLEMTFEYDLFLFGTQKSHLEDVVPGYNTLVNDQDEGYGARGSFKLIRRNEDFSMYIEPFIRYWNIEDSDIDVLTYFGEPYKLGLEPANNTTEYGIKLGLRF